MSAETSKGQSDDQATLLSALNRAMATCGYVQKDGTNAFHKYRYASEGGLLKSLRKALVEEGILLIPSLDGAVSCDEHGNTHLVMAYTLAHVSGAVWPQPIRVPGSGNDKSAKGGVGDKGPYKAMTGANKYLLMKLLQVATGDDPEIEDDVPQSSTAGKSQKKSGEPDFRRHPIYGSPVETGKSQKKSGEPDLLVDLPACRDAESLKYWAEAVKDQSKEEQAKLWERFGAHCKELGIQPGPMAREGKWVGVERDA